MKPIPLLRVSAALSFAASLADAGAPVEALWRKAGLPARALFEPERLVPFVLALRFMEGAAAMLDEPDLGLRIAGRTGLVAAGRFGAAIRRAPTLYAALETACELVGTHNSAAQFWLVEDGMNVRFCRRFRDHGNVFRQADLLTLGIMVKLVRSVAGAAWRPRRVEMQSAAPYDGGTHDILSDADVEVGRPVTSIILPRAMLSRPLPALDRAHAASGVDSGAPVPEQPNDFLSSLEVIIGGMLESGRSDVGTAARAAGWSMRTFQRRLAESHVSYSQILDRVRLRIATQLLEEGGVKVIEIALLLGYSDPAHFTRAFRRWTSLTPLEYRQLHRAAAPRRPG